MSDIEDAREFLTESEMTIYFYEESGEVTETCTEKSCAKKFFNEDDDVYRHYLKTHRGTLVHPEHNPVGRMREIDIRWHHVNAVVFDAYMEFLKTGSEIFYRQAEREMR